MRYNATLYGFTSYSNGIHGLELSVVGHIRLSGFKVADNVVNGMEIQETRGIWGGAMIMVYVCLGKRNDCEVLVWGGVSVYGLGRSKYAWSGEE